MSPDGRNFRYAYNTTTTALTFDKVIDGNVPYKSTIKMRAVLLLSDFYFDN